MTFLMSWTRGAPGLQPRAGRPPASLLERLAHTGPEQPLLSFYTVCGLEMNVDVLWALTFLGQCGVCGLDLMLTWGVGDGPPWTQANRWSGERHGAFSEKSCLRVCVCHDHAGLGGSKPGRRAWSKLHYQEYLGERISVNPNRYKDFCVFALSQIYWKTFCFCFHF